MTKTTNGDEIVLKKLDDYVATNKPDKSASDYTLQIDFPRLESNTSAEENTIGNVIKDIIEIKPNASKKVLLHPVIETYIDLRWKRVKKYACVNFIIYVVFLLNYSWLLGNMFYRELHVPTTTKINEITFEFRYGFEQKSNIDESSG